MTLLVVEDLSVRFGTTTVVRGVSLEVPAGTVTGVLGANGAGKTTTLLGICARVPRVSGRVVLDGRDVTGLDTVGLVRAGLALEYLYPNKVDYDNTELPLGQNLRARTSYLALHLGLGLTW